MPTTETSGAISTSGLRKPSWPSSAWVVAYGPVLRYLTAAVAVGWRSLLHSNFLQNVSAFRLGAVFFGLKSALFGFHNLRLSFDQRFKVNTRMSNSHM